MERGLNRFVLDFPFIPKLLHFSHTCWAIHPSKRATEEKLGCNGLISGTFELNFATSTLSPNTMNAPSESCSNC
jgi:hypothetical protein